MAAGKCSLSLLRADKNQEDTDRAEKPCCWRAFVRDERAGLPSGCCWPPCWLWAWQPWAGPRTGVVRLAENPLTHTVVATGYVSNTEESVLGATLTARVASTPVEEGQSVRAGDV